VVRDLVDKQFTQWVDHRQAEQRRLEQDEKVGKLQLELDRMRQERELRLRRELMQKQLHDWARLRKEQQQHHHHQLVLQAAGGGALPWTGPVGVGVGVGMGASVGGGVGVGGAGAAGAFAAGMATQPALYRLAAAAVTVDAREQQREAEELRRKNEELQVQKQRIAKQLQEERDLFLERQRLAVHQQRAGEEAVKTSAQLAQAMHQHFQEELVKSRR
jgi:hypothetical protein